MAHLVETMAYVGQAPWHGLGSALSPKQPLEIWQREAGMDWQIQESPVHFKAGAIGHLGSIHSFPEQKVLYRSDTKAPLSVVSNRYQVVQPREVMEFYRELTEVSGYELETAGVLKGGRKLWALARTGQSTALKGNDVVNGYLLQATSCDGTLATRRVKDLEAKAYLRSVLCELQAGKPEHTGLSNERALNKVLSLYEGRGRGAELEAAKGTAWGLLNSVTDYVDHERRARSNEYRMDTAWFGQGAVLKQRALDSALRLVA